MSLSSVITLTQDLGGSLQDDVRIRTFYDELIYSMALVENWIVAATLVNATAGTSIYTIPTDAVRTLGFLYDGKELDILERKNLEALNPDWRDEEGMPLAVVLEDDRREFRLFPTPNVTSEDFIPGFGAPLGRDYPARTVVVIHTQIRTDYPNWLDQLISLRLLEKDFMSEGDHKDIAFSTGCKAIQSVVLRSIS